MRWLERLIHRAEAGDPEAGMWVGFLNLTLLCAIVIAVVLIAWIWI